MTSSLKLLVRGVKEVGFSPTWDALRYQLRCLWYRLRFKRAYVAEPEAEPEKASDYVRPRLIKGYRYEASTLTVECANGCYRLTLLSSDMVQVHFGPTLPKDPARGSADSSHAEPSGVITHPQETASSATAEVDETESAVELRTRRLTCRVAKDSGRLTFLDTNGTVINEDASGAGYHLSGAVICQKRIQRDERFYGLGERACELDRRGRAFQMWNTDLQGYEPGEDPLYLCIPFVVGLHHGGEQGYGLFFDNTFRGQFNLGIGDDRVASFTAVGGPLCYIFIYGSKVTSILDRYTALTGRMSLPPLWALGYHQSRWSYFPEERVRRLARDFRRVHHVPCDVIHLDIDYMDGYRCFTWDRERFPDPAGLIHDLHELGFKVVVILDPGIKADPSYFACQRGLEREVFCKLPDGTPVKGPAWAGDSYFPDFSAAWTRSWWTDMLRRMTKLGIDGVWNDMNEPAVFGPAGTTLPDVVQHDLDGRGGDHVEAHNLFGLHMARATAEGLAKLVPGQRILSLTRSGWAGVQRYAGSWTGDNGATWDHLRLTIPMVLGLGLSGVAFTGPDIGGFRGHPSGELFTRWLQMSVFLPFFRAHTHSYDPDQEPWSWGEPFLRINCRWIEHRYRLLPYLYTAFWQCSQTGLPVTRPLLLAHQDDPVTHRIDDAFLCGDHLLIAPILTEGSRSRTVYLPRGAWYDAWSDKRFNGAAWVEVEAPLSRIPVFVRAGAVVPVAPVAQYVGERRNDGLTLHVYPPIGNEPPRREAGEPSQGDISWLYEDDGATDAHERGEYLLTRFRVTREGEGPRQLHVRRHTEGRYDPLYDKFELVIHGAPHLPVAVTCDGNRVEPGEIEGDPPALHVRVGRFDHVVLEEWA